MSPKTLNEYEQEALIIERLTRIEVTLEKHIEDETETLNSLKEAIDTLKDAHAQAKGGVRFLAILIVALSALGGLYEWARHWVMFK